MRVVIFCVTGSLVVGAGVRTVVDGCLVDIVLCAVGICLVVGSLVVIGCFVVVSFAACVVFCFAACVVVCFVACVVVGCVVKDGVVLTLE